MCCMLLQSRRLWNHSSNIRDDAKPFYFTSAKATSNALRFHCTQQLLAASAKTTHPRFDLAGLHQGAFRWSASPALHLGTLELLCRVRHCAGLSWWG